MTSLLTNMKVHVRYGINLFSTTACKYGQNKMMKKILSGTKKNKRMYPDTPASQTPVQYSKGAYEGKRSSSSRRVMVLNKLFMRHITDLMATGESSNAFIGHGIEINRVKVTPDYQMIQVYWLAKGTQGDDVIDTLLNDHAGQLRHELTQLRVIGIVPKIRFVKDKQYAQLVEIDERLARADFGEDHEPSELATRLKTQLQLQTTLDPHIKEKIKELDLLNEEEEIDSDIPEMPQNVLGLDHANILERVTKSLNKSAAAHRITNQEKYSNSSESFNENPLEFANMKTQREAFRDFLTKRQIMRAKAKKDVKNERPELDYLEEEWYIKNASMPQFEEYIEDKDYIEEE